MRIGPQTKLWLKVVFVGLFSRSTWRTAIQDALSQRYGFAMTWVRSQWNTQSGDNRSTALSLLWVTLYVSSSLSLSLSLSLMIYICSVPVRFALSSAGHSQWPASLTPVYSRPLKPGRKSRLGKCHEYSNLRTIHFIYASQTSAHLSLHFMTHTSQNWKTLSCQFISQCAHLDRMVFISKHLIQWITGISFGGCRWFPYFTAMLIYPQLIGLMWKEPVSLIGRTPGFSHSNTCYWDVYSDAYKT